MKTLAKARLANARRVVLSIGGLGDLLQLREAWHILDLALASYRRVCRKRTSTLPLGCDTAPRPGQDPSHRS